MSLYLEKTYLNPEIDPNLLLAFIKDDEVVAYVDLDENIYISEGYGYLKDDLEKLKKNLPDINYFKYHRKDNPDIYLSYDIYTGVYTEDTLDFILGCNERVYQFSEFWNFPEGLLDNYEKEE